MPIESLWLESIDHHPAGVLLEVVVFVYCFCALALVCDSYLVLSLETFCVRFHVREDVAGATFMALGSAAPELIISSLNTIQGESDLGVGAIVGSGMLAFSVLPGLCALVAGKDLLLKRRPLARDSMTYLLALVCLTAFFSDGFIVMWEAATLLTMYAAYVLMVILSPGVRSKWVDKERRRQYEEAIKEAMAVGADRTHVEAIKARYEEEGVKKSFVERAKEEKEAEDREKAARVAAAAAASSSASPARHSRTSNGAVNNDLSLSLLDGSTTLTVTQSEDDAPHSPRSDEEADNASLYEQPHDDLGIPPRSLSVRAWHAFTAPLAFAFRWTCVECQHDGPRARWYPLTFLISFLWVSLFSFTISAVAQRWNETSGLPLSLFGIVLVAVGAEIPDGVQSLSVARRGYGAMALSNSCGAQITNVLFGLGLPWTIANIAGYSRGVREGFQCERDDSGATVEEGCEDAEGLDGDGLVKWRGVQVREHSDALIAVVFQLAILSSFIAMLLVVALAGRQEKARLTRRKGLIMLALYPTVVVCFCVCSTWIIKPTPDGQYYAPLEG